MNSKDRVYVFNRTEHPLMVFDRDGNFLRSWGEGLFIEAHGICIGPDDSIYLVDRGSHDLTKYSSGLRLQFTVGTPGRPPEKQSGKPFNLPADVALSPAGEIYIADGYGNSRIHKFSPDGKLMFSWGEPGDGPGQFNLPHSVWDDGHGRVFVADRENNRIQIFTPEGRFLDMWTDFRRPAKLFIDRNDILYVAELQHRVSILTLEGKLLARWGEEASHDPGLFWGPHGIWTDSRGDLYVGEVLEGQRVQKFAKVG